LPENFATSLDKLLLDESSNAEIEQIEISQFAWSHRFILKWVIENLITKKKS
jgi:hypothetical protein